MSRTYLGNDCMITSLGFSSEEVLNAVQEYRQGCSTIDDRQLFAQAMVAAKIDTGRLNERAAKHSLGGYTRLEQLFILAIGDVIRKSGVDPESKRTHIIFSTTKGNIDLLDEKSPLDERVFIHTMASTVAKHFGLKNNPLVISNACISGVTATIIASRLIQENVYDHVIVAGGDILTKFIVTGFQSFKSVSPNTCLPYDESRDGLTLGEGCSALLLTNDRNRAVQPYIELVGGGISNDANHISGPSRTGEGLYLAIRQALDEAKLDIDQRGFVNGHGTATLYNDEMESKAYALAGLQGNPTNGLKGYFGHQLGASGVTETILCAHQLRNDIVFGTMGFSKCGTSQSLDLSPTHRTMPLEWCVKTASGFGGCNAALVLKKADSNSPIDRDTTKIPTTKSAQTTLTKSDIAFPQMIRERFKKLAMPDMKFYKMDDLCKLGYVAAGELLKETEAASRYPAEQIGIILANRSASLDTDIKHQRIISEDESNSSPAVFVYTLPNVVAGEVCIRHKIKGENTFFIQSEPSEEFIASYSQMLIDTGRLKAVIYGWCELLGEDYLAKFTLLETK